MIPYLARLMFLTLIYFKEVDMEKYFIGVDVSKGYADFVIIDRNKNIIEPDFQLDDTFEGHQLLYKFLQKFLLSHPGTDLFVAVESTGGYENNWFEAIKNFTRDLPIHIARVNPKGISHNSKAAMRRVTTDRTSAFNIAEYQIHHPEKLIYNQDDQFNTLRRLLTTIRMMVKAKTQFFNELETLLYTANPELMTYRKNSTPNWLLQILRRFPDAESLAHASVEELSRIPYVTVTRAKTIIENAQNSIASANDEMTKVAIVSLVDSIIDFDKKINHQIKLIEDKVDMPQVELLCSFNSIGVISAIELLIEIGCIERFRTVKHLASFFGLHPVFKESGDGASGIRMSKQGRRKPRATLYMVALAAIRWNPLIQKVYQRELKKGKVKMAAIGVCMHKILRIVYGMLKKNSPFDPAIDEKNQRKNARKSNFTENNKIRRYQKENLDAPISRKQTIKRKERNQSQSDNITKYEIMDIAPYY